MLESAGEVFVKWSRDPRHAAAERRRLREVAGPGVVPVVGPQGPVTSLQAVQECPLLDGRRGGSECGQVTRSHGARECDSSLTLAGAACSLADVSQERAVLSAGEVRGVAVQAALALSRVHDAGLVHGDVKPANLLLSRGGELWLCDFDAAAEADGQPLGRGSPGRAPRRAPARPETDVAALAITLIELATGVVVDLDVAWSASELRRLGCPSSLAADLALLLDAASAQLAGGTEIAAPGEPHTAPDSSPAPPLRGGAHRATHTAPRTGSGIDMRAIAALFDRGEERRLPAPARRARRADPTPTVEFLPALRAQKAIAALEDETVKGSATRSLAATLRRWFAPATLPPRDRPPRSRQPRSQAKRSS